MNLRPWRAKIAALVVLFFLGTFAGQLTNLMERLRGRVEAGARVTDDIRATVTTIGQAVDAGAEALRAQVAKLQDLVATGTATPQQVADLSGLVERLRLTTARPGTQGPAGPAGAPGPPGPPAATSPSQSPPSTTSTTAGGTTTTTRRPTTTTTRAPTTTTTRCTAAVGRLIKVGC